MSSSLSPYSLAVVTLVAMPASSAPMFMGLGDLPGGAFHSEANSVSADGQTVVGDSDAGSSLGEVYRWQEGAMTSLGDLYEGEGSNATGVSADGSVVVGFGNREPLGGREAFRWTSSDGMVGLGYLTAGPIGSEATGISDDGRVVVGFADSPSSGVEAFRWEDGVMEGIGHLPGFSTVESRATGVSANGSIIVGFSNSGNTLSGLEEAFRWSTDGGMEGLGDLPGGLFASRAFDVSPDGSIVVGSSDSILGKEPFLWKDGEMIGLGFAPGQSNAEALGVSADGSVVVGTGHVTSMREAFYWSAATGSQRMEDILNGQFGLDLTGWTLIQATSISDDGRTVVGWGTNPSGEIEGWIAVIPEPSTALLLSFGLAALGLKRRPNN